MKIRYIIFFLFISLVSQSQTIDKAKFDKHYFKSYWLDTRDIAISPIKWDKKEWIGFGGVAVSTAILMSQDININNFFLNNHTDNMDFISEHILEDWGSGVYSMSSMAILYTSGLIFKNQRSKKVAMQAAKGYLISGLYVQIPKYIINRKRPYHETPPNPFKFIGPMGGNYYKSMPSGHTTSVFTVATIVATEYSDKVWVQILAYSIATMSALSRTYDNVHWSSDIFVGAAFGFAMGKLISKSNNWGFVIN